MAQSVPYLPGDPGFIDFFVGQLKSQGIFDEFRKECIADVDTKPAYQNLHQKVESYVALYLKRQNWNADLNKNQVREKLRKYILDSNILEQGIDRIVDQVVNPKVAPDFIPRIEDVIYKCLGIEIPNMPVPIIDNPNVQDDLKMGAEKLLPDDLEPVSPDSVKSHEQERKKNKDVDKVDHSNNSIVENQKVSMQNSTEAVKELSASEESLVFKTMDIETKKDNLDDSHMSGMSDLASHGSKNTSFAGESQDDSATHMDYNSKPSNAPATIDSNVENTEELADESMDSSSEINLNIDMSPLTPVRNYDRDENSCDAQPPFDPSASFLETGIATFSIKSFNPFKQITAEASSIESKNTQSSEDALKSEYDSERVISKFGSHHHSSIESKSSSNSNKNTPFDTDSSESKSSGVFEVAIKEVLSLNPKAILNTLHTFDKNNLDPNKVYSRDDYQQIPSSEKSTKIYRENNKDKGESSKSEQRRDSTRDDHKDKRDSSRSEHERCESSKSGHKHRSNSSKSDPRSKGDTSRSKHRDRHNSSRDENSDRDKEKKDRHDSRKSDKHKYEHHHSSSKSDTKESSSDRHQSKSNKSSSRDSHTNHSTSKHSSKSKSHSSDRNSSSTDKSTDKSNKHSSRSSEKYKDHRKDKNIHMDGKKSHETSKISRDDKNKSSNSNSNDRKDDEKKPKKSSDDHYSSSGRNNTSRRSSDRDSNDGNSGFTKGQNAQSENPSTVESFQTSEGNSKNTGMSRDEASNPHDDIELSLEDDISLNDNVVVECKVTSYECTEFQTKEPIRLEDQLKTPIEINNAIKSDDIVIAKIKKPKIASNAKDVLRIMKIRKQMALDEREQKQAAIKAAELRDNIPNFASQIYSGLSGPEVELTCKNNVLDLIVANSNNVSALENNLSLKDVNRVILGVELEVDVQHVEISSNAMNKMLYSSSVNVDEKLKNNIKVPLKTEEKILKRPLGSKHQNTAHETKRIKTDFEMALENANKYTRSPTKKRKPTKPDESVVTKEKDLRNVLKPTNIDIKSEVGSNNLEKSDHRIPKRTVKRKSNNLKRRNINLKHVKQEKDLILRDNIHIKEEITISVCNDFELEFQGEGEYLMYFDKESIDAAYINHNKMEKTLDRFSNTLGRKPLQQSVYLMNCSDRIIKLFEQIRIRNSYLKIVHIRRNCIIAPPNRPAKMRKNSPELQLQLPLTRNQSIKKVQEADDKEVLQDTRTIKIDDDDLSTIKSGSSSLNTSELCYLDELNKNLDKTSKQEILEIILGGDFTDNNKNPTKVTEKQLKTSRKRKLSTDSDASRNSSKSSSSENNNLNKECFIKIKRMDFSQGFDSYPNVMSYANSAPS